MRCSRRSMNLTLGDPASFRFTSARGYTPAGGSRRMPPALRWMRITRRWWMSGSAGMVVRKLPATVKRATVSLPPGIAAVRMIWVSLTTWSIS